MYQHCFWHCANRSKWQCVPFPHRDESTFKDFSPTWSYADFIIHRLDLTLSLLCIYGLPGNSWPNTALFVSWPKLLSITEVEMGWKVGHIFLLSLRASSFLFQVSLFCASIVFRLADKILLLCLQFLCSDWFQTIFWADLIHSTFYSTCRQWWNFPVNISTHHSIGKPLRILILFWSSHFILHTSPKNTLHCHICTKIKYIKNTFYLEKLMQIT